jgi:hypothetical protein
MGRVDAIDVWGLFFIVSVRGNMSIGFRLFLKNRRSREHVYGTILL